MKPLKIKVWIKSGKSEIIEMPFTSNFCIIQNNLTEKYGILGWMGYEIIS